MTTTRPSLSERLEAARAQQATAQAAELEANRTAADEMLSKLTMVIGDADDTIGEATTTEEIDAALTKLVQELQQIMPALATRAPAPADQRDRPRTPQPQTRSDTSQQEPRQPQSRREAQQAPSQPPSRSGQGGVGGWIEERTGISLLGHKRQH